jgi:hypothetical protein
MARTPQTFKRSAPPLDPAVLKLIDAIARTLARDDDARERSTAGYISVTPAVPAEEGLQP